MSDVPALLIHHAANRGTSDPPGSVEALRHCLAVGARVVEIDVIPLVDGDFALLHDERLDEATDGTGAVATCTSAQIRRLRYRDGDGVTDSTVGLLSEAMPLIAGAAQLQELQIDLKTHAPLYGSVLEALLHLIAPVESKVRVSSAADWALRQLRELAPNLALGFDPLFYLDLVDEDAGSSSTPPFRVGAYGYRDDHPLAGQRWGSHAEYLTWRAEALAAQAPPGSMWFIRADVLAHSLEQGFDWIAYLHARGAGVDAWTLDAHRPGHLALAQRILAANVDRITTNDAPGLAAALGGGLVY